MKIIKLIKLIYLLFSSHSYGFYKGHKYLNKSQLNVILSDLNSDIDNNTVLSNYEEKFASYVGSGKCISFAAARMAFYALMKSLSIDKGSEVIITGFTCAVMANAVIRTGANIIYADIDPKNYGSSYQDIKNKITPRTKMIVAQHTFGVPCDIKKISTLCNSLGIFLLEDCALSFDSKCEDKKLGNYGDAAIFSTDETKPINTIIGGLIYTKNDTLFNKLNMLRKNSFELNKDHQTRIYKKFLFSRKYYNPNKYVFGRIMNSVNLILNKLIYGNKKPVTLNLDSTHKVENTNLSYPYPAKLPTFVARIGLYELENWDKEKKLRKTNFDQYKKLFLNKNISCIYDDISQEITPLRFLIVSHDLNIKIKNNLYNFFIGDSWFSSPLIGTKESPVLFGYKIGDCPVAENICKNIINLPCNLEPSFAKKFIEDLSKCI